MQHQLGITVRLLAPLKDEFAGGLERQTLGKIRRHGTVCRITGIIRKEKYGSAVRYNPFERRTRRPG